MVSYLGRNDLPRGIRNNNPGNLVLTNIGWQGKIPNDQNTDGHFEQFTQIHWGIRAMMKDLINDIGEGTNTLTSLINEYAPPHENDTANYVSFVSNATGILPDQTLILNKPVIRALVKAKITLENGTQYASYVTDQEIERAFDVLGVDLPEGAEVKKKSLSQSQQPEQQYLLCPSCSAKLTLKEVNQG